jgi:hypothetical protein
MTELERKALMGNATAQKECIEKGIVLPCPFCGGKGLLTCYDSAHGKSYNVKCENKCVVTCGHFRNPATEWRITKRKEAIAQWNTRTAPPIARCGECQHQFTGDSDTCFSGIDAEYCSAFEPKLREETP